MTRTWLMIGVLAAVVVVSIAAWRLAWFRAYSVSVTCNGHPAPDARVYRHRGDIFVDLGRQSAPPYIIRTKCNAVGIPGNSFVAMTRFVALAKKDPVLIVDMRSAKNDSRDPKLALTEQSATFIDNDGRTVRLAW